jgi:hypothetical protein
VQDDPVGRWREAGKRSVRQELDQRSSCVASICAQMNEETPSGNIVLDGFHAVVGN